MRIAITSVPIVLATSYASEMGSENASMPMKCIDQIPPPIAIAPPPSQRRADERFAFDTRTARTSAVYETRIATITERQTSHGSYVPVISAPFGHPNSVFGSQRTIGGGQVASGGGSERWYCICDAVHVVMRLRRSSSDAQLKRPDPEGSGGSVPQSDCSRRVTSPTLLEL